MRTLRFAAVLLFALPLIAQAEDAPPPPAPEATPGPKEAMRDEAKPDQDGKAAEQPKDSSAPAKDPGAPPVLPLKSESFADIKDAPLPGPKAQTPEAAGAEQDRPDVGAIETAARNDIFAALKTCSLDFLKSHVNPEINFVTLFNNPGDHRGEVVKLTGTLRSLVERDADPPNAGVAHYWLGQISVGDRDITSFIMLDPLPPNVQKGRAINVIGIFMKRYDYEAENHGTTVTPLVIVRNVERALDYEPASYWMNSWPGIVFFVVVGGGLAFYLWARMSGKGTYPNRFTRIKQDREPQGGLAGPKRSFPRPPRSN